jgi:uncharacterized protein YjbJ (UPF0337 family)
MKTRDAGSNPSSSWHPQSEKRSSNTMNKDTIEGNWKQMKGAVKARWGKLTDDDLTVASGNTEILRGRIQERYGIAREEAQKQLDEFLKKEQQPAGKH